MEKVRTITLTLDLEDWLWDFKFKHNFPDNQPKHEKALKNAIMMFANLSYNEANFSKNNVLFVTGNVIQNYPSVIELVKELGLVIGCHCYDHLSFKDRDIETARHDLQRFYAVAKLNNIEIAPYFRAPMFSIKGDDTEHLELIFEYFDTESGVISNSSSPQTQHSPVTQIQIFGLIVNLGGTALSWMPLWMVTLLSKRLKTRENIHIYLHPYELVTTPTFSISFSDLRKRFSFLLSVYYYLRQYQWNNYNGSKMAKKIRILGRDRIMVSMTTQGSS